MIQLPQSLLVSPLYPVSPSCILFPSGLHLISPYPSFFFCYFVIFNCSLSPFLPSSSRLAYFSPPSTPFQFLFSPCMIRILLVCLSLLSVLALRPPPGFLCSWFSFLVPPSVVFLLPFAHPSVVSSPLYSLHPVCVISNCIIIFSLYPVLNLG